MLVTAGGGWWGCSSEASDSPGCWHGGDWAGLRPRALLPLGIPGGCLLPLFSLPFLCRHADLPIPHGEEVSELQETALQDSLYVTGT